MGQQMSGPESSNGSCVVRVLKINDVARAQLTFQMLTLLQKYLYRQSQY